MKHLRDGIKSVLRPALPAFLALASCVICFGAQQASAPELERFTVLRGVHVLGPSVEMTAAEANCAITGAGDSAGVKCSPVGVTQKNAYTYNVALIAQADGMAYVIACRIGLVSNLWCKSLAEGRILRGTMANGRLKVADGDKSHDYLVLQTAQIGPVELAQPAASEAPAKGGPAARAPATALSQQAIAAQAPQQNTAAPAQTAPAASPQAPREAATAAPAVAYPTLGDLPAACVSAAAALSANSACVSFVSEPQGADIYVDGKFVGSTPSVMPLTAGTHKIRIEAPRHKTPFKTWTRTLQATAAGKITVDANLEPAPVAK